MFDQVMEDPQPIHNCRDDGAPSIVDPLLTRRSDGQGYLAFSGDMTGSGYRHGLYDAAAFNGSDSRVQAR